MSDRTFSRQHDGDRALAAFVIGKAQKPRCFTNMNNLPVDYRANRKAWMTGEIFLTWIQKLDRQFCAKNRKVLMVLDNCSAHSVTGLSNIEIAFLPLNTTSALQPMDQGIIQFVKTKYRRCVLERMLLCHDVGKQYDMNLLSAVSILAYMWKNTPAHVIANCFRHSGFVVPDSSDDAVSVVSPDDGADDGQDFGSVMPDEVTLDDYVGIDAGVATAGSLTDEQIVKEVMHGDESDNEELEEEQPHHEPHRPSRTVKEAAEALVVLEEFCFDTEDSMRAAEHLEGLRKIVSARISARKQTSIRDYFVK